MNEEQQNDRSEDRILDQLRSSDQPTSDTHDAQVRAAIARSAKRIREGNGTGRVGRSRWGGPWASLALAATFVLAVGVGLVMWTGGLDDPLRAPIEEDSVSPAHQARLRAMPQRLSWLAQPGTPVYRIKLRAASGKLLWSGESYGRPEIELPPDVVAAGVGQRSYLWIVEIEGAHDGELGPYWFHVSE